MTFACNRRPINYRLALLPVAAAVLAGAAALPVAQASSHREAPYIATQPKVDGADFYMFSSYETGRSGYVTLLADYLPLQDGYGGPNTSRWTRTRCMRFTSTTTVTPKKI